jgi:ABC-type transport system involved in multi-copper enzyme maturation permease subunit
MIYRQLLRYNARICTGLGPWLIVVPVAATMLVLFALMAMTSLIRESTPVLVLEMLGSILMAFVGVNLLRPEYQYNTLETVLTRPVSFRVILWVRVLLGTLAVLVLQALLGLYMRTVMHKPFDLGLAILGSAASMAFLTALAIAVAAAWRSPMFGFMVAGGFWVLDLILGPQLNPLFTLRAYSMHLASPEGEFGAWGTAKVALAIAALVLVVVAARAAARPVTQRSVRRYVRTAVGVFVLLVVYVTTGAVYKVRWGEAHEATLLNRSRLWYRTAMRAYGPLPVVYLFGPAFPRFIGYHAPWTAAARRSSGVLETERTEDAEQLRIVAFGYPNSRWADNALYELGRWTLASADEDPTGENVRFGEQCLEELVTEHPSSAFAPAAWERLAKVYLGQGRLADSRAAVDRLLDVYPSSPLTLDAGRELLDRLTAPAAVGGPNLADAAAVAEKLTRVAGSDERPEVLLRLGLILANPAVARYAEARTALQQAADEAMARTQALAVVEAPDADTINLMRGLADVRRQAKAALDKLQAAPGP